MDNKFEFTLLENALDFIVSSIKHLGNINDKYSLKYSILHLSSGVELIFKSKLLKENWEYLFQDPKKINYDSFINGNFTSVNSVTCIKRLKNKCGIIFTTDEEKILSTLREKRNKLEHFSIIDTIDALKAYHIKVLSLMIDFIGDNFEFKDMNHTEIELLEEIRNSLTELQSFVNHRLKEIEFQLNYSSNYNTPLICPSCLQAAMITDDGTKCLFCGYSDCSEKMSDRYLSEVKGLCEYSIVKSGGEYPKYNCIECGVNAFIHDEDNNIWRCLKCGIEYDENDIDYCDCCGNPYNLNDDDIGICEECIQYKIKSY